MYLKLLTNRNNKGERKQLCMKKIRKIKCLFGPGWERGKNPRTTSMCTHAQSLQLCLTLCDPMDWGGQYLNGY